MNQTIGRVSAFQLPEMIGKIKLIDIRETYEYERGFVPTAVNIPANTLLNNVKSYMNPEEEYHIICQSGGRSGQASRILAEMGYKVVDVAGGTGNYPGPLHR